MDNKALSEFLGFEISADCTVEINVKLPDGELHQADLEQVSGGGLTRSRSVPYGGLSVNIKAGQLKSFDTSGKFAKIPMKPNLMFAHSDMA